MKRYKLKNYSESEKYYLKSLPLIIDFTNDYLVVLNNLSILYKESKNLYLLYSIDTTLLPITATVHGTTSKKYALALNQAGNDAFHLKFYNQAIKYHQLAIDLTDVKDENYYFILANLSNDYLYGGRYLDGEDTFNKYAIAAEKHEGVNSEKYAYILNDLAVLKMEINKYEEALTYYQKALQIETAAIGTENKAYIITLVGLGKLYNRMGFYEEAELNLIKSVNFFYKNIGPNSEEYITSLTLLANVYISVAKFDLAEKYFNEAFLLSLKSFGEEHILTHTILINSAINFMKLGRYEIAHKLLVTAMPITKKIYGEKSLQYADNITSLGALFLISGQYEKSLITTNQSYKIINSIAGFNMLNFTNLINLSIAHLNNNNFNEALITINTSIDLLIKNETHVELDYAKTLAIKSFILYKIKNYEQAKIMCEEALHIKEKILGINHPSTTNTRFELAIYNNLLENKETAETLFKTCNSAYFIQISSYFPTMSEADKNSFYNTVKENFTVFNNFIIDRVAINPKLSIDIYNNQLITKGLLFNSVNRMRKEIVNSGDSLLISNYRNWRLLRAEIVKQRENKSISNTDLFYLENKANEIEKDLTNKSTLFAQNNQYKHLNWENIRTQLKPNEIAIEIIKVPKFNYKEYNFNTNKVYYIVLIITPNTKSQPQIIVLENGIELETKYLNSYQNAIKYNLKDKLSYEQYWQPIAEAIPNYKSNSKIYLSLDGVYNKINLNTLFNKTTNKYVLDEAHIQFVSSTRDILTNGKINTPITNKKAVLIGYPEYKLSTNKFSFKETFITNSNTIDSVARFIRNGVVTPLPGTKIEIESIEQLLINNHIHTSIYEGEEANEKEIKQLLNPYILHIATHGFFNSPTSDKRAPFGMEERNSSNLLEGSGLLLAGAQNTINGEFLEGENGILTAHEAMNIALDHTELVVLSACETGLGNIQNGEGVYGLQRSFQVAGAKSVIMSLWTVDDSATQEMMTNFYTFWLSGKEKHVAFKLAQMEVREHHPHPYYWGSFIMVGE